MVEDNKAGQGSNVSSESGDGRRADVKHVPPDGVERRQWTDQRKSRATEVR